MAEIYDRGVQRLVSGRLAEAAELLERAHVQAPDDDAGVRRALGLCHYRTNDFERAARALGGLPGTEAMVAKLQSFQGQRPYEASGPASTTLELAQTDPVPVVRLDVEGRELFAIVDTGGSELHLDTELATELGLPRFGTQDSLFAGGQRATYEHSRVERLGLGDIHLRRVPVLLLPTRRFSAITGGRLHIGGVVGTNLLAQFRSTIDYPAGRLVLERWGDLAPIGGAEVPFQTYGLHLMVTDGSINGIDRMRFLVDCGLAGGAFTCPERTLRRAGIPVPETQVREGAVGGGPDPVAAGVFEVRELGLGPLRQQHLVGIYIPGTFEALEARGGDDEPEARGGDDEPEARGGDDEPEAGGGDDEPGRRSLQLDGLISHGFLRRYRWTIDARRSVFVFAEP